MKNTHGMKNNTQGFTLIELLIVIAIIGILAAVLIPNLLGARASANARAGQAHNANAYKAALASLADNNAATATTVAALYAGSCMTAVPVSATVPYGIDAPPAGVTVCTIAAAGNDFTVTTTLDESGKGRTFINGKEQTK